MKTFYVSVPNTWSVGKDWSGTRYGDELVHKLTGTKEVVFIVNSSARLSDGDLYRIKLHDTDDEVFYLLRTGFTKIDDDKIETYLKCKYPGFSINGMLLDEFLESKYK